MNERDTDEHGFSRIVIRVHPRQSVSHFQKRRHERSLNTIDENSQISPLTQIFLCASAPLR
jgi:hypothetical protein